MADQKKKTINNKIVTENKLDYLEDLYHSKIPLSEKQLDLLKKSGRIDVIPSPKKPKRQALETDDLSKGDNQQLADQYVDVVEENEEYNPDSDVIILESDSYDRLSDSSLFKYSGGMEIDRSDWMPDSVIHHKEDFVRWVDSINNGFQRMVEYKPFQLYCQQTTDWLADGETIHDQDTYEDKKEFAFREIGRCRQNTLYFMDKYLQLKEGDMGTGSMKYLSKPVHKVIAFMFDCGYSTMTGKPRQIAATSTYGGCALAKICFNRNFFLKFITMDKESGIEIFEDKIKYPFSELPNWMKPEVSNDRENQFRLSKKSEKKGTKKGVNSKISVVAPSVAAINGGSPQLVMIDEAGYISMLGKMIKEARPTIFWQNPETKLLETKRQIIIWGTGGEMDKGGKAYEEEYYAALEAWKDRNFEYGIIPIFFDWTTRPGITKDHYNNEKRNYTIDGPGRDERMVQFRQHYPTILEDMFLTSSKLLVSIDWINTNLERIQTMDADLKPKKGYFEPIYDTSQPADENSDVDFKITGATFIPVDDADPRASVTIFMDPKHGWENRYFQGTDPVASDNGFSKMASAIFDSHYKTIAAVVNYRESNHKHTFLQNMLLGLYYSKPGTMAVKELVESNIGLAYIDYKDNKGFYDSLVYRTELPEYMQGGNSAEGIDNRGARTRMIINKMFEFLDAFGDRMWIDIAFKQLRTFVCKVTNNGTETWGTIDTKKYDDDVLFAIVFAYICSLCYEHTPPKERESELKSFNVSRVLSRDNDGGLYYREKKERTR
ncbi:MAG: hypothetical protein COA88_14625 [Kordia sp.]|nr:MAG: hypothetical protein COA88_14625 [Kordia sp.]